MNSKNQALKAAGKPASVTWLRATLLTLSLLGTGISGYLVYAHFFKINPVCLPGAPCEVVLTTRYAEMWGVPLSLLGLLMYLALVLLSSLQLLKRSNGNGTIPIGIYGVALSGVLFSLYLLYLEAFVIHGYCTWCLASGIVILATLVISVFNLSASGLRFKGLPHYLRVTAKKYVRW